MRKVANAFSLKRLIIVESALESECSTFSTKQLWAKKASLETHYLTADTRVLVQYAAVRNLLTFLMNLAAVAAFSRHFLRTRRLRRTETMT